MTNEQQSGTIPIRDNNFNTWQYIGEMRWLYPQGIHGPKKLQQAWRCLETGRIEWRDISIEVLNDKFF